MGVHFLHPTMDVLRWFQYFHLLLHICLKVEGEDPVGYLTKTHSGKIFLHYARKDSPKLKSGKSKNIETDRSEWGHDYAEGGTDYMKDALESLAENQTISNKNKKKDNNNNEVTKKKGKKKKRAVEKRARRYSKEGRFEVTEKKKKQKYRRRAIKKK